MVDQFTILKELGASIYLHKKEAELADEALEAVEYLEDQNVLSNFTE